MFRPLLSFALAVPLVASAGQDTPSAPESSQELAAAIEAWIAPLSESGHLSGTLLVADWGRPVNIGMRREDDKTFRDWLDTVSHYWYETGRIQGWYDDFLVDFGVDPADSPPIQREQIFMR